MVHGQDQMPLGDSIRPIAELVLHPLGREIIGPHLSAEAWKSLITLVRIVTEYGPGARSFLPSPWPLLDLVAQESFRDVTDDRDRILAFLDVANDVDERDWEVAPDYTASVEHMFLRFARWCLLRKNSTELLHHAGRPGQGTLGAMFADMRSSTQTGKVTLPSWVPDWRHYSFEVIFPIYADYNASAKSKLHVSWRPDQPAVLRIKGRIVDKVDEVSISRMHLIGLDQRRIRRGDRV